VSAPGRTAPTRVQRAGSREYDDHDCGGPSVCSSCSSWRHGVYEDGSGDPEALAAQDRCKRRQKALIDVWVERGGGRG
jgi:hypothetical protein